MTVKCSIVDNMLVAEFDPTMFRWLRASLPRYRDIIQGRLDEYREYDWLCERLSLPLPVTPLDSTMLRALRDNWCDPVEDDALRDWMEADLVSRLRDDADLVLSTLPAEGDQLLLHTAEQVEAWFWVLVNMRIAYGVEHGVLGPGCPPIDKHFDKTADWNDPLTPARFAVWWLHRVAESLRKVSGQPLPEYSCY
ncbi:DUF2017 family protein [Actinopolyspora saharensis]|uniref:Uncharacterized protein n=1 Tax=Actinopolyspora saharensis TaxID=995062 RepID=A0A1H1FFK8_9ACTN|nr:DUF2017 family protein [Actinopolyspora saharensis]SDQ99735.1 protein of unknown function [Actinopolyspora saharensis]